MTMLWRETRKVPISRWSSEYKN